MDDTNTISLFTDEQIATFSQLLDEKFDFTEIIKRKVVGTAVEAIDGKLSKWTFDWLNNLASPYVPDAYKANLTIAIDDLLDGDGYFTEAGSAVFDILDAIIAEVSVNEIIDGLISAALSLLRTVVNIWLESKVEE